LDEFAFPKANSVVIAHLNTKDKSTVD